jgi:hypothetical protein
MVKDYKRFSDCILVNILKARIIHSNKAILEAEVSCADLVIGGAGSACP